MRSLRKLHVNLWAEKAGTNIAMTMLAQQVALNAGGMFEAFLMLRSGSADEKLPSLPPLQTWFGFYTDHRGVTRAVASEFPFMGMGGAELEVLTDQMRLVSRTAKQNPAETTRAIQADIKERGINSWWREWCESIDSARGTYKRHLEDIQDELAGKGQVDADSKRFGEAIKRNAELYYFARVFLPCVGVYQTYPLALFRRAVRECSSRSESDRMSAIEDLVRLDPRMVHHEMIIKWAEDCDGRVRRMRREKLSCWVTEGLDHGRFSRRQWKESMGGFIAVWSHALRHVIVDPYKMQLKEVELKASTILALFDAATRDRQKKKVHIIDPDLARVDKGSFTRAVVRFRRLWRPMTAFNGFAEPLTQ